LVSRNQITRSGCPRSTGASRWPRPLHRATDTLMKMLFGYVSAVVAGVLLTAVRPIGSCITHELTNLREEAAAALGEIADPEIRKNASWGAADRGKIGKGGFVRPANATHTLHDQRVHWIMSRSNNWLVVDPLAWVSMMRSWAPMTSK
jgi:hypothetical protein